MADVVERRLQELRDQQGQLENILSLAYSQYHADPNGMGGRPASSRGSGPTLSHGEPTRRTASAGGVPRSTVLVADVTKTQAHETNVLQVRDPKQQSIEAPEKLTSRTSLLTRYFNSMSEYPDYHQRRQERLSSLQPFSFDLREKSKEKSIARQRFEEENQRREAELQEMLHHKFRANPVPPSTFIHKYEVMVQEWCARKATSKTIAHDRARRIQEEALPAKRYAENFQKKKTDTIAAKRAASEQAERERRFKKDFKAREVPLDVKLPRWEEMQLKDSERYNRIRFRAEQLLAVAARPPRMEEAENYRRTKEEISKITEQSPVNQKVKKEILELQKRNPNFTFSPTLHATVPDYEYLWAKDRVEMMKKKQSRPPTVVQEFPLHRSTSGDAAARVAMQMKRDEEELLETRWPYKSKRAKVKPTPPPKTTGQISPPRGTHAHELKAECAFKRIISDSELRNQEAKERAEREQKQKELNKRMAPYFAQLKEGQGPSLEQRIKDKKLQMRRSNAEAKQKLDQLKTKVRDEPPLFMEPSHFDAVAKARAATEEQVLLMLKEHGLGEKTLQAIMTSADVSALDAPPSAPRADGSIRHTAEERSLVTAENNLTQQRSEHTKSSESANTSAVTGTASANQSVAAPAAASTQPPATAPSAASSAPLTAATLAQASGPTASGAAASKKKKSNSSSSSSSSSYSMSSDSSASSV